MKSHNIYVLDNYKIKKENEMQQNRKIDLDKKIENLINKYDIALEQISKNDEEEKESDNE